MRTTIDINEELFDEAFKLTNISTKKALIELSLKTLIKQKRKERLKTRLGNFELNLTLDNLKEMRSYE